MTWGVRYWEVVFRPTGVAMASLATSISIALLTVAVALAVSIPAGYALARLRLPFRALIMIVFLLPQAFPGRRDLHQRGAHLLRARASPARSPAS